ncbi:TrmH family RNA methyltransferase [Microbacterium resistens]|uniref:TrmH family RNA methyltransferase n=1 Tax=Microbacterium resistens TaxID=156977 RepID=A0ABU1SDL7_9MICO|nr:TrmH family RNA methyltransferase [Microbacterium resistens]MDR6866993.1 TrmH family RNA methyltransferase [Microbacterium resistens]
MPQGTDRQPVSDGREQPGGTTIDSVRHPAVRRVADVLRTVSAHPRTLLIDDEENIEQAIAAGVSIDALYATPGMADVAEQLRERAGAALHIVADDVTKALFKAEKRTRVFALAKAPRPAAWQDVAARRGDIVVLDGVRIAGNIGAIIRSACAFDAAGVVLLDSGLTTAFDRRLIRASRGLTFAIPLLLATGAELAAFLREQGIPLASLAADADSPLRTIGEVDGRLAILMGSERTGASEELDGMAGRRYSVPMMPGVESLNVSVAAGIALYERRRLSS